VEIDVNGLFKSLSDPDSDLMGDLNRPFTAQHYFLVTAFGFAGFFMYGTFTHQWMIVQQIAGFNPGFVIGSIHGVLLCERRIIP